VRGVPLLLTCLTPRARDILADGKIWRCRSAPPCALLRHVCCVAGLQQGAGIALIGCVDDGEGGELTVTCLCAVSGGQLGGAKCAALRAAAAARWLRRWRVCAQMLVAGRDLDTGVRDRPDGVFGAGATTWDGH
jgi:hypothetical protein